VSAPIDFHTFLRTRRSIRRFKPDPVPDSAIERILATAAYAPSAHDLQPWRFAVMTTSVVKSRLGRALTSQMRVDMQAEGAHETEIAKRVANSLRRIDEAPAVILLCRDAAAVRTDAPEEVTMGIQSTALAGLQLLLAAHAEGLGANWICWPLYAQSASRAALGLPKTWEPQAMIFVGYAANIPEARERKLQDEIVIRR
jgi:F420 biosynthesis protein FbiB-like protein